MTKKDPSITEIKYLTHIGQDYCRRLTFSEICDVDFEEDFWRTYKGVVSEFIWMTERLSNKSERRYTYGHCT